MKKHLLHRQPVLLHQLLQRRLRPGADIAEKAKVGNFVEIKAARIEAGAKVNHLSYIGDARVGAGANIGAGTITCNYDGFDKHRTDIGAGAFIGSNSALVAPVRIGDGAYVGSGSVITKDVDPDALAFCFPAAALGTQAAGAELVIQSVALQARCDTCRTDYAPETLHAPCPGCGGFGGRVTAGREMRVVSFHGT